MKLGTRRRNADDIDLRDDEDTSVRTQTLTSEHEPVRRPVTERFLGDDDVTTTDRNAAGDAVAVERTRMVAPGLLLSMLVGAGFIVLGAITAMRGGLGGDLYQPQVEVAELTRTPAVGLLEMGLGAILVVASILRFTVVVVTFAIAMAVSGGIVAAAPDELPSRFALERPYGWVLLGAGVLILLAGTLLPTTTTSRVERVAQPA